MSRAIKPWSRWGARAMVGAWVVALVELPGVRKGALGRVTTYAKASEPPEWVVRVKWPSSAVTGETPMRWFGREEFLLFLSRVRVEPCWACARSDAATRAGCEVCGGSGSQPIWHVRDRRGPFVEARLAFRRDAEGRLVSEVGGTRVLLGDHPRACEVQPGEVWHVGLSRRVHLRAGGIFLGFLSLCFLALLFVPTMPFRVVLLGLGVVFVAPVLAYLGRGYVAEPLARLGVAPADE